MTECLPLEAMRRIHERCEQFESAWHGPQRPRLQTYLADALEPERSALLAELLALELELRVAADEQPTEAEYKSLSSNDGDVIERVFRQHRQSASQPEPATISNLAYDRVNAAFHGTPGNPSIAGYEILEVLGRGGMGVVYKARDLRLKRIVALKMILAGDHASPHLLARFRTEAELVARLQHPNIVQIFDVGEADGHPFIAFEYIEGKTLAEFIDREPQPSRTAAELLEAMALAAHYAHLQGIVHRDLKPANILMQVAGGQSQVVSKGEKTPSSLTTFHGPLTAIPKITDFGLAKDLENTGELSATGNILGTPNYMSPEQADGRVREVGPASDIYSLGAILYVLLTGRPPHQGTSPIETLSMVMNAEPVAPTQLQPRLPRDLETICLKCLHKDPARRYESAGALADDLRRFLNDETILARPSGRAEKTWRLCRRNPLVAALMATVFVVLIAGAAISTNYAFLARREADAATREKTRAESIATKARERAYRSDLRQIQTAWDEIDLGTVYELLDAQRPEQTEGVDLRSFEWHYWNRMAHSSTLIGRHAVSVKSVCYSPDGKLIASAGADAAIRIWEPGRAEEWKVLRGHVGPVNSVCISPDGRNLVSAGNDHSVRIWDLNRGQEVYRLDGHRDAVTSVSYSRDGKWIVSASSDKTVKVWNAATGTQKTSIEAHPSGSGAGCASFSPDGKWIVTGNEEDPSAKVWNVETSREEFSLVGHSRGMTCVVFSPDGNTIATACRDLTARIWDCATGKTLHVLRSHRWDNRFVCFSPDGKRLATTNFDKTIKIWNTATGHEEQTLRGHMFSVNSVSFHSDGHRLVSGSADGTVRTWEVTQDQDRHVLTQHQSQLTAVACSPDGRWLVSAAGIIDRNNVRLKSGELFVWDRQNDLAPRVLVGHPTGVTCAAFSPDGSVLASGGGQWDQVHQQFCGGDVRLWDPATGNPLATWTGHLTRVLSLAISPDSQLIATGGVNGDVLVRRLRDGGEYLTVTGLSKEVTALAFSTDGRYLAVGGFDLVVNIWDVTTREQVASLPFAMRVSSVAFRPDGEQLAIADYNLELHLYNAKTFTEEKRLRGHSGGLACVTYSLDGRRIATGSEDSTVKVWDTASGQELLTLKGHTQVVRTVKFSPNGHTLYSGSWDRTVRIWDATPLDPMPAGE